MASRNLTVYRGAAGARAVNQSSLPSLAAPLGIALGLWLTRRSPKLRAVLAMVSAASMAAQWYSRFQGYRTRDGRSPREDQIDDAGDQSFPASDPPAFSAPAVSGNGAFHKSER